MIFTALRFLRLEGQRPSLSFERRRIAVGMARQGYDLQLTRYDEQGWRATFLCEWQGTFTHECDGYGMGADAVARGAGCGVGSDDGHRDVRNGMIRRLAFPAFTGGKTMFHRIALITALAILSACSSSLSDVKPGDGQRLTIRGHDYPAIWQAALRVADEHFEIRDRDQSRGVILAERTMTFTEPASWVGIYITPPVPGATAYTVEVVRRKQATLFIQPQDWERKVLRDVEDVLAGRRMR